MNLIYRISLGAIALLAVQCASAPVDPDVEAADALAHRVVPAIASDITFVKSPSDSVDSFTLSSADKKIIIEANNANSMAMGLNYYLQNYCLTEVSWYRLDKVTLPDTLPLVGEPLTVKARLPYRFFLNYCTSGYSMPWWSWEDWERFIDWMALNGVNLPLATTGQEAIWYNVWKKLGLTDSEILEYFTGPAHLPWHRMCNLDGWQSPLPESWLKDQADLQKKVVARERQLGMRPVLPGFAGHVPGALTRVYPDAKTTRVMQWGGFPDEYRCTYLSPVDPLFAVIQKEYLKEQTRLYGTDHIYGIDPFNEVDPPTWNPDSLAEISHNIFESLTAVDPEATWLQMAWLFYADPEHWNSETARAFLQGVPEGRMILLDYYCESTEEWKLFDKFYGQPYIWCYLGNFGGNSFLVSPLNDVDSRISDVLANGGDNLCGIGSTLEGLDINPYMYEYILSRAWQLPQTHQQAMTNIIDRRVGHADANARAAWQLLVDSVFIQPALCGQGPLVNARPSLTGFSWWTTKPNIDYPNALLLDAWGAMLDAEDVNTDMWRFDIVNLGRQTLSNYFMALRDDFTAAYESGDIKTAGEAAGQMRQLLADLTTLLRGHHGFTLRKWIEDARAKGTTPGEKDYYERNARTLISIWGPAMDLNDYANRQWAELNDSYYAVRWNMFLDQVLQAMAEGKKFDADKFLADSRAFENAWIEPSNTLTWLDPLDTYTVARGMYDKYAPLINAHPASGSSTSTPSLHHW